MVFLSSAAAQVVTDVAVGPSIPNFSGPTFANTSSVSVATLAGSGAIYTWNNLPGNPASTVLPLSGPLGMTAAWTRLDDRTAAYDAAGGGVALVHGLPAAPQVLATTFMGPSAELRAVDATTAVRVTSAGFHVLRHDSAASTHVFVPSPELLVTGQRIQAGAAGADTLLALGAGPDGLPNTLDDRLVRLDGLSAAALTSLVVSNVSLPQAWAPEGFVVVPSGAAVLWVRSGLGSFDLSIIQVSGASVVLVPMSIATPAPFGFTFGAPWTYWVDAVTPNGVRFRHDDDVGSGNVLIGNLDGTPAVVQSWFDDPSSAYTASVLLNDRDIVFLDTLTTVGFNYVRWTNGTGETYSTLEPLNWASIDFAVPNHRVLAAFSQVWSSVMVGQQDATITIERQLPGGHSTVSFVAPNAFWVGTAPNPPFSTHRCTRLAGVTIVWNVMQHFYPYFEVVRSEWPAALHEALGSAATDQDERAFLDTLRRLIARLHDGHGGVYHRCEDIACALPLTWDWIEGKLVITAVGPGVPAGDASRPEAGDIVRAADGKPAEELIAAQEKLTSAASSGWMRWRVCTDLLRGPKGDTVLDLGKAERPRVQCRLSRAAPRSDQDRARERRPDKIAELRPATGDRGSIWYVDLDRITDEDFKAALPDLTKAQGLIFDLRGYPSRLSTIVLSHLIAEPITCARWNVPRVCFPDRERMDFTFSNWEVEPDEPRLTSNTAFIIDGRAISYAETYLGMVEHYHLAALVSEPTAGTNGNVNPIALPGGYQVSWTGMKVLKHDGSQHHAIGIRPTVPVSRTIAGVRAGKDELLEVAIATVDKGR